MYMSICHANKAQVLINRGESLIIPSAFPDGLVTFSSRRKSSLWKCWKCYTFESWTSDMLL